VLERLLASTTTREAGNALFRPRRSCLPSAGHERGMKVT